MTKKLTDCGWINSKAYIFSKTRKECRLNTLTTTGNVFSEEGRTCAPKEENFYVMQEMHSVRLLNCRD